MAGKRRGGFGKRKGGAFERKVCKDLSLWISHGARQDLFWRSAMSGGRATLGHKRGVDLAYQSGDICGVHPMGHRLTDEYFVECKHVRDLCIDQFIFGNGILAKFWGKAQQEAAKHKRRPLLIAKQNNVPTLLVILPEDLQSDQVIKCMMLSTVSQLPHTVVLRLDDLLSQRPEQVIRFVRQALWKEGVTS